MSENILSKFYDNILSAIEFMYTLQSGKICQGGTVFVTKYKLYNICYCS